jgi:hypothetical protein
LVNDVVTFQRTSATYFMLAIPALGRRIRFDRAWPIHFREVVLNEANAMRTRPARLQASRLAIGPGLAAAVTMLTALFGWAQADRVDP